MSLQWDYDDPLGYVKPGETKKSNQGLRDYATMGPGRSLRKLEALYRAQATAASAPKAPKAARRPPTTRLTTIKTWSRKYAWVKRVERWDQLQNMLAEAAYEEVYETAKHEHREEMLVLFSKARAQLEQMLTYPLAGVEITEHYRDGRPKTIVVKPGRWNVYGAAKLLAEVFKNAQTFFEEPAELTEQRVTGDIQVRRPNVSALEDEELNDLIFGQLGVFKQAGPREISQPAFGGNGQAEAESNGRPPE